MGNIEIRTSYTCLDDCEMSGCPQHDAVLKWLSTTDGYHFVLDGEDYFFRRGEIGVIVELLRELYEAGGGSVEVK